MRITNEAMVASSLRRLSNRLDHYQRAQTQIATGKRILKPSDDPASANRGLGLRAQQRAQEQALRNGSDALSWLNLADSQMEAAVDRLQRARDLSVRAASSVGDAERRAIAAEIDTIRAELEGIANSTHRGRPLFAGHSGGAAVAKDAAGTWRYVGDDGEIRRRVGESDLVTVNVTADDVFGFSGGPGADVFSRLDALSAELRSAAPDPAALQTAIADVDGAIMRIADSQAYIGAQTNWVDSALRRTEDTLLAIRGELAEVEDVDYAEAILELQTQELAYTATLQSLAKALPPSLMSFLR